MKEMEDIGRLARKMFLQMETRKIKIKKQATEKFKTTASHSISGKKKYIKVGLNVVKLD